MKNKIGLILEGGANRGIFTAGVLDFFQHAEIRFPYVAAVSVGCCAAMDYVSGQPGRTKSCMVPEGRNAPPISYRYLLSHRSVVDFDLIFNKYPNSIVPFDFDSYQASDTICEYVVTNCVTGQPEYVSEFDSCPEMMKLCTASCSMPFLCRKVIIDGISYLDGGISDAVPLRHAEDLGYEKNIVVLTRAEGYRKQPFSKTVTRLGHMLYHAYPELIRRLDEMADWYNETQGYINKMEKQGRVLVIRPDEVVMSGMDSDTGLMKSFYSQGYSIAARRKDEIVRFLGL